MSPHMAKEVIKRTWDEVLMITESVLVPSVYGQLERDRKVQVWKILLFSIDNNEILEPPTSIVCRLDA